MKDRHTEISNGIENSVSNLIQQEGKVLFLENERSVSGKDENEQDSNKAAQDFGDFLFITCQTLSREIMVQFQTLMHR